MEFLKNLFSDKALTFDELVTAINAHNGAEANKANQIKVANLGGGEYVGKGKYDALEAMLTGKNTELETANNLIAELKSGTKGNEEMQGKITEYETVTIPELQKKLAETKLNSELKVALLGARAKDIDYLTYKLRESGKTLELGEDEKIKGIDEMLSDLKTQFPAFFETGVPGGGFEIDPNKLQHGDGAEAEPKNLAEALSMEYKAK
jgi:hypothetical protein